MRNLKLFILAPFAFAVACGGGEKSAPPAMTPSGSDTDSGSSPDMTMDSGSAEMTAPASNAGSSMDSAATSAGNTVVDAGSAVVSTVKDAGAPSGKKPHKKPAKK